MGLFSRDTDVYVSSVIYQLGNELDQIPDIIKANMIAAGMRGQNQARTIQKSIIDGGGIQLRQAYAYAASSYYVGIPIGLNNVSNESDPAVLETLVREYLTTTYAPAVVDLKVVSLESTSNYLTILRQQIESTYNYDFLDERVHTSVFGIPVESTLVLTGLQDDLVNHDDEQGWRLAFTKPDTTIVSFDEWYPLTLFDEADAEVKWRILIQVSFDGGPTESLSYDDTGGSASLNLFLRNIGTNQAGTFPPLVIRRRNAFIDHYRFYSKTFLPEAVWKSTSTYKTSKVYARKLGVDMSKLMDILGASPDIGQIDYAFVQPGTIISSPNQCALEYHFNYFNRLRLSMPDNKPAFDAWLAKSDGLMNYDDAMRCPAQNVHIYDPDAVANSINMVIAWRYMTYEEKSGALTNPYEIEVARPEGFGVKDVRARFGRATKHIYYDFTKCFIRKRLTESTYAELMIVGLWHENYVYKGTAVKSGVWDAFNDPDGDFGTGFLIPLELAVLATLSPREQLQLSQETNHLILNCYKVVKEKWYQTGIFKIAMVAISVVLIVISYGTLAPQVTALNSALYGAMIGFGVSATIALALAAVLSVVIIASVMYAVSFLAQEAGQWAAEQWGAFWGAVVQIGVAVALTWGLGWASGQVLGVSSVPMTLVQQVVMVGSQIISGLAAFTQYEMDLLTEEVTKWNEYLDSSANQMKQLEELWEENFPEMSLPAQMWFMPMETPDQFLSRTLSSTDSLTMRLTGPIEYLSELTLTPRLQ